jgi:N6-adenosine-specific RNA methylase IME4
MKLNGGFPILLIDPPWDYANDQGHDSARGGTPYEQMSIEDLCSIAPLIDKVAAKDCVVFLWGTNPKLPEVMQFIESLAAYKFKFVTVPFEWVKLNPTGSVWAHEETHVIMTTDNEQGTTITPKDILLKGGVRSGQGYWTAGNIEYVTLLKRGSPQRVSKIVKQIVFAPLGEEHSAKPEEVRTRINQLMGDLPGLELFARLPKVRGWKKLGYEITGNDIRDDLKELIDNG